MSPEIDSIISDAATNNGIDPDTMRAIAGIESSGNPNAVTGSYRGLFQPTGESGPGFLALREPRAARAMRRACRGRGSVECQKTTESPVCANSGDVGGKTGIGH